MVQGKKLKKWFMLQVWRIQQVAQIITLLLLALNLALQMYGLVKWRGQILQNAYITVPLIVLILFAIIWGAATFWDLRSKMWRAQATVLVERNPYARERLTSKEILQYSLIWIPALERLGRDDKKYADMAVVLRQWMEKEWVDDPQLPVDVAELMKHIGSDRFDLTGLKTPK